MWVNMNAYVKMCVNMYIYIYIYIKTNESYNIMPYNFQADLCLLKAELYDINSNVKLSMFRSQMSGSF